MLQPNKEDGKAGGSTSSSSSGSTGGTGDGWDKFLQGVGLIDQVVDPFTDVWNIVDSKKRREHELYMAEVNAKNEAIKSKAKMATFAIGGTVVVVGAITLAVILKK